mgnify:CR=1 FL=1
MPNALTNEISLLRLGKLLAAIVVLALLSALSSSDVDASTAYTYDQNGRLLTAQYDNGSCIGYQYDANGNRTQGTTVSVGPIWGSNLWACFAWTPH